MESALQVNLSTETVRLPLYPGIAYAGTPRAETVWYGDTVTACPYKGTTSRYWSVRTGGTVHPDLAWAYDFPTRQLQPIAGLIAFYNEQVDLFLSGQQLERPKTHFFASAGGPNAT